MVKYIHIVICQNLTGVIFLFQPCKALEIADHHTIKTLLKFCIVLFKQLNCTFPENIWHSKIYFLIIRELLSEVFPFFRLTKCTFCQDHCNIFSACCGFKLFRCAYAHCKSLIRRDIIIFAADLFLSLKKCFDTFR